MTTRFPLPALFLPVLLFLPWPAFADWPQFRGPDGNGTTDAALPETWSDTENILSKIKGPK